jgi:hypothetical protein
MKIKTQELEGAALDWAVARISHIHDDTISWHLVAINRLEPMRAVDCSLFGHYHHAQPAVPFHQGLGMK